MQTRMLTTLSTLLTCAAGAAAQTAPPAGEPVEPGQPAAAAPSLLEPAPSELTVGAPADPASDVHLSFTPYFWLTSFNGTVEAKGIQLDVDKTVIDILNGTDKLFGLMGALDLDYNRFVCQLNGAWGIVEGSETKAIRNHASLDADVTVQGAFFELLAGYRVIDTAAGGALQQHNGFKLDAYGGIRRSAVSVDMTLIATATVTLPDGSVLTAGQSAKISQSGDWFEPFVGLRGIFNLDEHWIIQLRGDIGGFGVNGSQFAWQGIAAVGYQWHCDGYETTLVGGYRALGQDYTDGDFHWDMVTHGPMLGLSFTWSF